jgi:hypothetical protein
MRARCTPIKRPDHLWLSLARCSLLKTRAPNHWDRGRRQGRFFWLCTTNRAWFRNPASTHRVARSTLRRQTQRKSRLAIVTIVQQLEYRRLDYSIHLEFFWLQG